MPVEDDIAEFKTAISADICSADIFEQFVAPEICRAPIDFDQLALRTRIGRRWQVPVEDVWIVGSAKLGFTLVNKSKAGVDRPAFSPFSLDSDIDVAVISNELFEHIWKLCFEFWHRYRYQNAGHFWPDGRAFRDYNFRGWMRPDFLPNDADVSYRKRWFEYFRRLMSDRAAGDYRITGGLFRNREALMQYQTVAIEQARAQIRISGA
ncbi:hypothetical protein [Qipengyuania sp. R86523]|uniref:hypothetical protein n=1 Tax=Qipengyuania sp. R86523 TaxID=3093862 RepID=UPI0037CB9FA6